MINHIQQNPTLKIIASLWVGGEVMEGVAR